MAPGPPRAAFAPSTGAYVGISLCSLGIALCFAGLLVYKILGRRKERQLAKERNERWNGKPSDAANGAGSTGTVSIDRQVNSGKEERKSITLVGRNESTMSGENESDDVDAISRVV